MNNDISNVTRISFVSSPKMDNAFSKHHSVKNKDIEQVQQMENALNIGPASDNESKTDDKEVDNLVSLEDAKKLAEQGNKVFEDTQRNLQFKVDGETNQVVVSVVDRKSGEVLRQIPSEEVLALAKRLKELDGEQGQGVFLKERA